MHEVLHKDLSSQNIKLGAAWFEKRLNHLQEQYISVPSLDEVPPNNKSSIFQVMDEVMEGLSTLQSKSECPSSNDYSTFQSSIAALHESNFKIGNSMVRI